MAHGDSLGSNRATKAGLRKAQTLCKLSSVESGTSESTPNVKSGRNSAKTRGKQVAPVSILGKGRNFMQLTGGLILIVSVFLGPLLAGSYYEPWRWPLIWTSSAAALLLILSGRSLAHGGLTLLVLLALISLQGVWMWFNAWGVFYSSQQYYDPASLPWRVETLTNQPFPGLPGTTDRAEAFDRLSYILPCLGLIWGVRQLVISRPSWCQLIAKSIFWSGVTIGLIGIAQRSTGTSSILWLSALEQGLITKHFFATYRSPGIAACFLNVALAMGLPSVLNALRDDIEVKGFRAYYPMAYLLMNTAGVIILTCAVITAGSKAGMALGVVTLFLFSFLNRRSIGKALRDSTSQMFFGNKPIERNIFIGAIICITVLLILTFAGLMSERWSAAHTANYSSMTGRIQAIEVMLKMMSDDGWGALGMGPGSFYPLFPYYSAKIDTIITGIWVYAHNDYLQTLVEWGSFGAGLFAACIAGGCLILAREILFHRKVHSKRRFIHLRCYLIAMVIFLVHATIEFPFQIESLAVIFSIMLGVAWAAPSLRGREIREKDRYGRSREPRRHRHRRHSRRSRSKRDRHSGDSESPSPEGPELP